MANYTLQSHGGEGLYMTADGTPTARRNVYIKARVSDSLDQTWRIDSPSNGARTRIFSCKSNNTGGYALNNATGTNNCDIISHISERGGSPLCGDKPSAERTRPQGCISAPLVPKGFCRFRQSCPFSWNAWKDTSGSQPQPPGSSVYIRAGISGTVRCK